MKKVIIIICVLILVGFGLTTLYVFNLPPFNYSKPTTTQTNNTLNNNNNNNNTSTETKVSRNKSYEEIISRAKQLSQSGFYSLSILEYQQAYNSNPQKVDPLFEIAKLHLKLLEFDQAKSTAELILKVSPENTDAQNLVAKALLNNRSKTDPNNTENFKQAQAYLDKITKPNQETKFYQALLLGFFDKYDEAEKKLDEGYNQDPNSEIGKKIDTLKQAFIKYKEEKLGNPLHLKTLFAKSMTDSEEYQMAIAQIYKVVNEKPDYRDAWIIIGFSYLKLEQYEEAIESLKKAEKIDNLKPETFFYLGLSYFAKNDLKAAVVNLQRARELGYEPKAQVDQKLAEIYLLEKDYEKSVENYEQAVSLSTPSSDYYIRPIWIYIEKLNKPDKALNLAQKAYETHPNSAMSFNLLGWAYLANNNFEFSEFYLKKAIALQKDLDSAYLNLGQLYEKKGDREAALKNYVKANLLGHGNGVSNVAAQRFNNLLAVYQNSNIDLNQLKANLFEE